MKGESRQREVLNSYSVVAYLANPVAQFVERVRREFTPDCPHRAHITILPPRSLQVSLDEALAHGRRVLARLDPFEVRLGDVGLFEDSDVIKLAIASGEVPLRTLHDALNTGPLDHAEEHDYVPHVTLGKDFPPQRLTEYLDVARERWRRFGAPPPTAVDALAFVQEAREGCWNDLAEMKLSAVNESGEAVETPVTLARK